MAVIPPLRFIPRLMPKLWGGRQLQSRFGRRLQDNQPVGESWEVADRKDFSSVAAHGPLKGKTLHEIMLASPPDFLGAAAARSGRFPLLIKYIDANDWLSLQVHPDLACAQRHAAEPKSEIWYIISATPTACIYHGFAKPCDRAAITAALTNGTLKNLLHKVSVKAGDVVQLPAGTLHAMGPGILAAELQENSDTTYRLHDWDRRDVLGKPRELHIDKALDAIRYDAAAPAIITSRSDAGLQSIGMMPSFTLEKMTLTEPQQCAVSQTACSGWQIIDGAGVLHCDGEEIALALGDTVLVPACHRHYTWSARGVLQALRSQPRTTGK